MLIDELLFYQSMMCQHGTRYIFEDFYSYDRHFRQRIANEPSLHWDRIDQELFAQHMRTLKVVCFKCRNFSHVANNCDFSRPNSSQRAVYNSNFRPSSNFRASADSFRASTDNFRGLQTASVSHSPHLHVSILTPMAFVTTSVVPNPIHVAPVVVNTRTSGVPTNDNLTANFNLLPTNICTPVNIDNLEFN